MRKVKKLSNIAKYKFTNKFNFIKGNFDLSNRSGIPYYMFSVPLDNLVTDFSLVSDLDEVSLKLYNVNSVFQRNIDTVRVEDEIVKGYLLKDEKTKFFNPITVAFIPISDGEIADKYEDLDVPSEIESSTFEDGTKLVDYYNDTRNKSNIILFEDDESDIGAICWDTKSVKAIAVDGQHRLLALKKYYEENKGQGDVLIPIIGMVFEDFEHKTLLEYLREIFIDINKNAKPVTKTRNIIMDDLELASILTKELICSDGSSNDCLRSEILDWQSDDPRPENDFQLTTIMILHRLISELYLENAELTNKNSWEEDKINSFVTVLNRKFNIDKEIAIKGLETKLLSLYASEKILDRKSFSLTKEYIELIKIKFNTKYRPIFHRIFNEFFPYRNFINLADSLNIFDESDVANEYIRLPKSLREQHFRKYNDKIDREIITGKEKFYPDTYFADLKSLKEDNLLFNVIGQIAVFKMVSREDYIFFNSYDLEQFFECFNTILANKNIFNKYLKIDRRFFWDSIATANNGSKISSTNTSINNITNVLCIIFITYAIKMLEDDIEFDNEVTPLAIIDGKIDHYGNENSPKNRKLKSYCSQIQGRITMDIKKTADDRDEHDDAYFNGLSRDVLKNFILLISSNCD